MSRGKSRDPERGVDVRLGEIDIYYLPIYLPRVSPEARQEMSKTHIFASRMFARNRDLILSINDLCSMSCLRTRCRH